ncbi:MAG: hypothetical protein ACRD9W_01000 [Terriglobia bacterium]
MLKKRSTKLRAVRRFFGRFWVKPKLTGRENRRTRSSMTDAVEKGLRMSPNSDSDEWDHGLGGSDDGSAERRTAELYLSVPA